MITKTELEDLKEFYSDDYNIQDVTSDVISGDVLFLIDVIEKLLEGETHAKIRKLVTRNGQ